MKKINSTTFQRIDKRLKDNKGIARKYEKIKQNSRTSKEAYATHDISHINRVINNAIKIAKLFDLDKEQMAQVRISARLHDIGCYSGRKGGHAIRSYEYASKLFDNNDNVELILSAIKEHSDSGSNWCSKILVCADKIDINKDRILPLGLTVKGNREYAHIKDIKIDKVDGVFTVDFITDGQINLQEMNEYYFTKKVHNSISDLAKHFNCQSKILLDAKVWKV